MNVDDAVEFLKQKLEELPKLRQLSYGNSEFPLWADIISDVMESVFGINSTEFERYSQAYPHSRAYGEQQENYIEELNMRETAMRSVIAKHALLGQSNSTTVNKRIPTLSELFDALKFHHAVVDASRSLFVSEHYAQAIFEAYKAIECFVKDKTGQTISGKDFMSKVFREDLPIIKLNELKDQTDKDEQEGFKFLFMGAMVGVRNPKAHAIVKQTDPYLTLEYLAFASMLLKRIDFWSSES